VAQKSNKSVLKLDWATYEAAKYACENWHYSECMPVGKMVKVGVWEDGTFIGVVIFSRGATGNIGRPYNLSQNFVCELTRISLSEHSAPVSRIVAVAIRFLQAENTKLQPIVSYADPMQNHHGGIYQAGNWIYVGRTKQDTFIKIKGKIYHRRSVYAKYGTQSVEWLKNNIDPNAKHIADEGKYKYLMPLDNKIRKQIQLLSQPYPKRVSSADSGTFGNHPEGGGASPTDTLQSYTDRKEMV